MELQREFMRDVYLRMRKIREFETRAMGFFAEGKMHGAAHLYSGEEAIAAGICMCLTDDDYITSTHRGHGHIIAKGGELKYMMAELFGRETGYCRGKGGSMHIADTSRGILGANGVVGAGLPIAVGAGLSCSYRGTDQVCVCFFGDGAANQGTFHESLNLASLWKLPVIFVCENNGFGISVSQERHMAIKDISIRAVAYGMPGVTVDGNDVLAVYEAGLDAVERARGGEGPTLIEGKTWRQRGHFEGDMARYKTPEEQEMWLARDPLPRFASVMLTNGFTQAEIDELDSAVNDEIEVAIKFAEDSPYPPLESAVQDVYTDIVEEVRVR